MDYIISSLFYHIFHTIVRHANSIICADVPLRSYLFTWTVGVTSEQGSGADIIMILGQGFIQNLMHTVQVDIAFRVQNFA